MCRNTPNTFVLLYQNVQSEKEALKEGREKTPKYQRTEDGFIRIGEQKHTLHLL